MNNTRGAHLPGPTSDSFVDGLGFHKLGKEGSEESKYGQGDLTKTCLRGWGSEKKGQIPSAQKGKRSTGEQCSRGQARGDSAQ